MEAVLAVACPPVPVLVELAFDLDVASFWFVRVFKAGAGVVALAVVVVAALPVEVLVAGVVVAAVWLPEFFPDESLREALSCFL